jgi:hypothetical protein
VLNVRDMLADAAALTPTEENEQEIEEYTSKNVFVRCGKG